jgi:hypothetical protein
LIRASIQSFIGSGREIVIVAMRHLLLLPAYQK